MAQRYKIALDAAGGDHGSEVVVEAAKQFVSQNKDSDLILVGDEQLSRRLKGTIDESRISFRFASEKVEMGEAPSHALRNKKDSSMRVAIDLIKSGDADACVSAGNTGALMATARFVLKMLPGVDRPGIITAVPSMHGHTFIIDLGANVDCPATTLYQFAVMGSELASVVDGITHPKVGLLNIGQEEIKGNERVKEAHALITSSHLNYLGYVEGDGIFLKDVDVVVTDGFVGNAVLKASEGFARFISDSLKKQYKKSFWSRIAGLISLPVLKQFRNELDPRNYNGAPLLGLNGIVIKSHGSADAQSFLNAIYMAEKSVKADITTRIGELIATRLGTERTAS